MKKLIVFSGAGISAESGIQTFHDMGGLWQQYDITQVASPTAWANTPELVMDFYNQRRKQLFECTPNEAHHKVAKLEENFNVQIITQNVDDLHERAGSSNILHLHGELKKVRSTADSTLIYKMNQWELKYGDMCDKGSQLRPHIVWFGEDVPAMNEAIKIAQTADIFIIIGTSLQVYPAAGLLNHVPKITPIYVIDPGAPNFGSANNIKHIQKTASLGMRTLLNLFNLKN